jgi:pyruvate-formate lyase
MAATFYKEDKEKDGVTRLEAQELVEFLWLKISELGDLTAPVQGAMIAGGNMTARVLTIGIGKGNKKRCASERWNMRKKKGSLF